MAYDIKNTKVIYLGRQGENLARTIEIDVSSMLMKWPDATISLLVQRNQEDTFYLAPVVIENGILKWTITNADTEIAGIGKIEVRAIQDDAIMKSATMKICVENSLGGTETDVPDPVQTWVDTIVAASVQAKQSAEDALASELAAKEAAESIAELESNVETAEAARVEAENERISAENERESAETSRETAENNRVAAETARVTAEQSRASAETARESAETDRQTTFETNESQRQTAFETAEAGRTAAESSRVAAEESRVSAETGRVEAESERVDAENQRAETFAGYETRIDAATPDDSTVDGKPWTSKKTVDSLCMPLEESGNLVQVYPVEGYPLGVNVSLEPTQVGEGDPSPDNIRPIKGRDGIKVERCGENLLNISKLKPEGFNLAGSNTLKPNTTYTFKPVSCGGINFAVFLADNIASSQATKQLNLTSYIKEGDSATFTTPSNSDSYSVMWLAGSKSGINQVYPNVQFMLVAGTTAPTAYEPYIGDTYTITLPETVYGGEVDVTTGVLTVNRGFISYNGEEPWYVSGKLLQDGSDYYYALPKMEDALDTNTTHVICSHYKSAIIANNSNNNGVDVVWARIRIRWGAEMPISDWKEQLAGWYAEGKPLQIAYELAEPYTIQLTPQQITALSGVNTLYTDSGDISVSGRTDMIWLTQSLIDRIAALETAAVSE